VLEQRSRRFVRQDSPRGVTTSEIELLIEVLARGPGGHRFGSDQGIAVQGS
jgi:hypothetical protein